MDALLLKKTWDETQFIKFVIFAVFAHFIFFIASNNYLKNFNFSSQPLVLSSPKSINVEIKSANKKVAPAKKIFTKTPSPIVDKLTQAKKESSTHQKKSNTAVSKPSPQAKSKIYATYPPIAEEMQVEGTVYMKYLIGKNGQVLEVKVTKSSGYSILDNAAVRAIKMAEFSPATDEKGNAIEAWATFALDYSLSEES